MSEAVLEINNLTVNDISVEIMNEGTKIDVTVKETLSIKKLTLCFIPLNEGTIDISIYFFLFP